MNSLSEDFYSVDIDDDLNYTNIKQISVSDIDTEYFPEINSFFPKIAN